MQILPSLQSPPLIGIVCCVHGDERFSFTVFDELRKNTELRKTTTLILANEDALRENVRFIENDLNRSFPGSPDGTLEERLAHRLYPVIREPKVILDIHTTTSDVLMTPIITNLTEGTREILRHTNSREIAYINESTAKHSLIGQVRHGVSLEFGEAYANTPDALTDITRIIKGLNENTPTTSSIRKIFHVDGIIPNTATLPTDARNFAYIPELDCYPFLLHERTYAKTAHALKAIRVEEMEI